MTLPVSSTTATVGTKQQERDTYLKSLLQTLQASVPTSLAYTSVRSPAEALVREHTFPTPRDEEWRFTDLTPMVSVPLQAYPSIATTDVDSLAWVPMPEAIARIVLVNGQFNAALSDLSALPAGVTVGSLAQLQGQAIAPQIEARLAQSSSNNDVFTALNTVGFQDAAVVWVPRNCSVEQPIQVVYLAAGQAEPMIASPRCLLVAETGSAVTLVEEFGGDLQDAHCTNSVTEIWADDSAQVTHVRLQQEGLGTFHIGKTVVTQGRDSRYTVTNVSLGARVARHNLEVYQTGAQTDTNLYGLTAIAGTQLADTHSLIALNHPHGTADQLHKCIVDDQGHAVFNGKVWVPRHAQLTNASQLNRNLLLSGKARVDTKPELDIVADNVKCAHGATVSQLNANEVFYLQSRGISAAAAQRLLIYGFAMDIIDRIPVVSLRETLMQAVTQRIQTH
ncbi:MAG: Fe-S cluster assembly protein SufD [Cyanobacteria bacterium J06638_28]